MNNYNTVNFNPQYGTSEFVRGLPYRIAQSDRPFILDNYWENNGYIKLALTEAKVKIESQVRFCCLARDFSIHAVHS